MTREEAVIKLAHIIYDAAKGGYIPFDVNGEYCAMSVARIKINEFLSFCNGAAELPSILSDLDEKTEEYANKEFPDEPSCGQWGTGDYEPPIDMEYPREIAKDSFKAGAQWIVEQLKQE